MANLLNVIPQANNKASSPLDGSLPKIPGKNPAKFEASELKDLFEKQLSETLSTDTHEEKPIESVADLGEIALAAGANANLKVNPIELKKVELNSIKVDPKTVLDVKNLKNTEINPKLIQVQNQLPVKGLEEALKNIDPKTLMQKSSMQKSLVSNVETPAAQIELLAGMSDSSLESIDSNSEFTSMLPKDLDFNVESVEVLPKAPTSKLSTTDFLNLREISQNPTKPNLMAIAQAPILNDSSQLIPIQAAGVVVGMKPTQKQKEDGQKNFDAAMSSLAPSHGDKQIFGKTMDATVTQSAGQKAVLSPESINQIGNQVNLLGKARQDGEIKIRLRPDHLGELQMSIKTQGQNVSIKINAENSEAKKIIEDSLGALREHLSQQNLSLSSIDVVTQPTAASTLDQTQMQFDGNQSFNQSSTNEGGRNQSQDGSQQSRNEFYRDDSFGPAQPASVIRPRSTASTRLDLIA